MELHICRQNIRNHVFTQIHLVGDEHHFGRCLLVQPSSDHWPDGRKDRRRIDDQTDAHALRIVTTEQPDNVLDQLIVHAARIEAGQIENDAQIVGDLFEAACAGKFLE